MWCPWRGSNARPLPYQGSALPLSHMGIDPDTLHFGKRRSRRLGASAQYNTCCSCCLRGQNGIMLTFSLACKGGCKKILPPPPARDDPRHLRLSAHMIDWSVGRNSLSRRHRAGVSGNITSGFAARICQRFLHDRDEPPEPLQRQAGALGSMMRANQNTIAGNGHPLDRTGMKAGMQAGFYRALRRMACGRTVSTSRFTTFFSRTMKRFNPSLIALASLPPWPAAASCRRLPTLPAPPPA